VRDQKFFKGNELTALPNVFVLNIKEAVQKAPVVIVCTPAQFAIEVAQSLGDVSEKIIIDTSNAVFAKPGIYTTAADAIVANCNTTDVVKCFNTIGFENIENPHYPTTAIDMFMAGDSIKGKEIARKLAVDVGFAACYDFGGNDKFALIEQFALSWINLAIMQKQGRDLAFKVIRRG
jgi:8-hydroxy-5-deazaflavin:NADPH oxidoreductase